MPTGATRVIIDGTVFERRTSYAESSKLGSVPVRYDWYINGLHVDAPTFKERFDEAARQRAQKHMAARAPKPIEWSETDREFLRSLRISRDDGPEEKAA